MASSSSKIVWFITGVSSGSGFDLALHALRAGHRVYGTVRDRTKAANAISKIEAEGGRCVVLDVTELGSIPRVIDDVLTKEGQIDVLVNNAGLGLLGVVEDTSFEDTKVQMDTNFFGPLTLMQSVIPNMRERRSGAIVNISSALALNAIPAHGAYSASKFALEGLSESLHRELAPFNVSVLIVEPGLFQTNFFRGLTNTKPLSSVYQNTPVAHVFQRITSNSAHNQQLGDPRKAARAIFNAVAGQPSERLIGKVLRLPLGSDANSMIEQKIENLKADNWKTREIAKSTDRDVS